jgi:hypothetical protein
MCEVAGFIFTKEKKKKKIEDTNEVIRSRISKKDGQCNGQKYGQCNGQK